MHIFTISQVRQVIARGSCKREERERIITNSFIEDGGDWQMMKRNSEER